MAQLKDLLVNGVSRFIGDVFANKAQLTSLEAPTTDGGSTYGQTSGKILKAGSSSIYWGGLAAADIPNLDASKITSGTLPVARGGTGQTSIANIQAGKDGDGNTISSTYLKKSGGTMTGALTLSGAPTADLHAATKKYVDDAFAANDAMIFKGTISGGSTGNYGALTGAANRGWTYKVDTAGEINGVAVEIGDILICLDDNTAAATSSNYATVQTHWVIVQNNVDGAVFKSSNSFTDGKVIIADGTNGKVKASSYSLDATVDSGTANRMAYYDTDHSITSAGHYVDDDKVSIGSTNAPATDEVFYVSGNSRLKGILIQGSSSITNANVTGDHAAAFNEASAVTGQNATAFGYHTTASGSESIAFNSNTTASGNNSAAFNDNTVASGNNSAAFGYKTSARGEFSFAEGEGSGDITVTFSGAADATSYTSTVEISSNALNYFIGYTNADVVNLARITSINGTTFTTDKTLSSTALTNATGIVYRGVAYGKRSHVEGSDSITFGKESHAEGDGSAAIGDGSHAEGGHTQAAGKDSHAEGYYANASGAYSHAEGRSTVASGAQAHAAGRETVASATNAHAEGIGTIARGNDQYVFGRYNVQDSSSGSSGVYVEIVGKGTANNDRSNARTLDWNGNETLAGNFLPMGTGQNLGSSSYKWAKLFVGTADSYGSGTQPIYWNNGVPEATTYSLNATINSGTANRMAYYSAANTIAAATNHYTSNNKLGINYTSEPTDSNLYVNGVSKFYGNTWIINTNGGSTQRFYIAKDNTINNSMSTWLDNSYTHFDIQNSGTGSNIDFKLYATDDTHNGADANTSHVYFYGSDGESKIAANRGYFDLTANIGGVNENYNLYVNGNARIESSPAANTTILDIVSNTTPTAGTWQHGIKYSVPNMVANSDAGIFFGKASSNGNMAAINFHWAGSDHNSNFIGIGFWNRNNYLRIFRTGETESVANYATRRTATADNCYMAIHSSAGTSSIGSGTTTDTTTTQSSWALSYYRIPVLRTTYATAGDTTSTATTSVLDGYFWWRQYSVNSSTGARLAYFENYLLPVVTKDRTGNASYNILTTKNTVTTAQGGTGNTTYTENRLIYSNTATKLASSSIITDGSYIRNVGGYNDDRFAFSADTAIINSWIRTNGATGWYNQTYDGGWMMSDAKWIRSWHSKPVYIDIGTNNTYGIGTHRLALGLNGANHVSLMLKGGSVMYGFAVNNNGNWYVGKRTTQSFEDATDDAYIFQGDVNGIYPSTTYAKNFGATSLVWQNIYTAKLNLQRNKGAAYGRISFYLDTYYTWYDYMSDASNGACPTGGKPGTLGNVTGWARRSIIENAANYGWTWEAAANAAASANTVQPATRMALSSNTGQLYVSSTVAGNAGVLTLQQSGNAAGTYWGVNHLAASLPTGNRTVLLTGVANSTKNQAYIGFYYAGSGSDNNFLTLGLYGADNLVRIFGNGKIAAGGSKINSASWLQGTTAIGPDSYDKIVIGNLQSTQKGAYIAGHNTNLDGWAPLFIGGQPLKLTYQQTQFFEVNANGSYALTRFGVNGQSTSYTLYVNGTSRFDDMLIVNSRSTSNAAYTTAAMQVREYGYGGAQTDNWSTAPRLGFHWGNRNAAQIGLASNGYLYECPGTGTTFYKIMYESGTWGIGITGNAATASYPQGFTGRSTGETWGNTVGTSITQWSTTNGGAVAWRYDNPQSGQASMKVDGTVYINEGQYPVLAQKTANGFPGFLITAETANHSQTVYNKGWNDTGWLRTTSNGFIPYQSGGPTAGHSSLGTSSWYFANAYIQNAYLTNIQGRLTRAGVSTSWYNQRDGSMLYMSSVNGLSAGLTLKTTNGSWSISTFNNSGAAYLDRLLFSYVTDANYSAKNNTATTGVSITSAGVLMGAAWNDYAEFRQTKEEIEPGRCVKEIGDDTLEITTKRLERGCEIVSDTYGFAIGETETCQTPIASSGRVLAYPYESREEFASHIGWPVCSGPNGTVSIMTEEEEEKYPSRIIGTISAVPDYEEWGTGNVKVNGRVWIRIR